MLLVRSVRLLIILLLQLFNSDAFFLQSNSSIVKLNAFFETLFTRSHSTTLDEWEKRLPTREEKNDMQKLLTFVYRLKTFENIGEGLMKNYTSLKDYVTVSILEEHFCVIHELIPKHMHRFPRMWGYTVIASKAFAQRSIHHSAAHFDSEGPVCAQAAALFENTKSRTLVIAGASRYAVKGDNRSKCQKKFQVADAAHSCRTMFHWVNTVLKDLAEEEMEADGKDNGHFFVQWHGMAQTSCVSSDVFISAGIHNCSIYDSNIPAKKLLISFNSLASGLGMKASTPKEDPDCRLTAATNIFGRYINGVQRDKVCSSPAQEQDVVGSFVHIEQKAASRENISLWTSVIEDAFPICQTSTQLSSFLFTVVALSTAIFYP